MFISIKLDCNNDKKKQKKNWSVKKWLAIK